jgi:hypothetical protein
VNYFYIGLARLRCLKNIFAMNEMITLRPIAIRPNVRTHARKDDFVSPSDSPGEGSVVFQHGMRGMNPRRRW